MTERGLLDERETSTGAKLGALHHVSIAVPDVEAAARVYEQSLGWTRLVDAKLGPVAAQQVAGLIGLARLDSAHGIMLQAPGALVGMIELIELHVADRPDTPAPELPLGPLVLSYAVADLDGTLAALLAEGFERVGGPYEMQMGGRLRAATVRGPHALPIEIIEFLGR
jgi:catechol 2,3-dioxygenase-like lactoylglutathione lyase family enzyme